MIINLNNARSLAFAPKLAKQVRKYNDRQRTIERGQARALKYLTPPTVLSRVERKVERELDQYEIERMMAELCVDAGMNKVLF
jgi:hypothetical protein